MAAFYIVSEALTNTAKHAHATVVHVDVETKDVMPGSPSATTASGVRISIGDRGSSGSQTASRHSAAESR